MSQSFKTPILFLIFNRADTTAEVFEAIRKAKPTRLFVAADGPRESRKDEAEKCAKTRAIIDTVDWPCEVIKLYRTTNLGCKNAVSEAISWFFDQVEEGIILEDDCMPSDSFFGYCENLLEKYRDDARVMHISGDGQVNGVSYGDASYYYSPFPLIWGWATWKRAWQLYDKTMASYPSFKEKHIINDIFPQTTYQNMWLTKLDDIYAGKIDTWDFQWAYALFVNRALAIIPNTNLITNIGFGEDATHTATDSYLAKKPRTEITKLTSPEFMIPNRDAIVWIMQYCYFIPEKEHPLSGLFFFSFAQSIYRNIRKMLGKD